MVKSKEIVILENFDFSKISIFDFKLFGGNIGVEEPTTASMYLYGIGLVDLVSEKEDIGIEKLRLTLKIIIKRRRN